MSLAGTEARIRLEQDLMAALESGFLHAAAMTRRAVRATFRCENRVTFCYRLQLGCPFRFLGFKFPKSSNVQAAQGSLLGRRLSSVRWAQTRLSGKKAVPKQKGTFPRSDYASRLLWFCPEMAEAGFRREIQATPTRVLKVPEGAGVATLKRFDSTISHRHAARS